MKPYGLRPKTKRKIAGHQHCSICLNTGHKRLKATTRQAARREIQNTFDRGFA